MSFGPSGSSINAMTTAVPKLVNGLTRGLFRADVERHWASLRAYDVPQAVVTRPARKMGNRDDYPCAAATKRPHERIMRLARNLLLS